MLRRSSEESKQAAIDEDLPSELCCPITYQPFVNPVLGSDGRFYEMDAIKTHLARDKKSPFTREILRLESIPPAVGKKIKNLIEECKQKTIDTQKKIKASEEKLSNASATITDKANEILRLETELAKTISLQASPVESHLQVQIDNLAKINSQLVQTVQSLKQTLENKSRAQVDISFPPGALTKSRVNSQFLKAVKELSIGEAKYYLSQGADINAKDFETEATALIMATIRRQENPNDAKELISILMQQKGIDINARDFRGCTALHRAAGENDEWVVNVLIKANANPLITNQFWQTAQLFGELIHKENFNQNIKMLLIDQANKFLFVNPPNSRHSFFHQNSVLSTSNQEGFHDKMTLNLT